MATNWIPVPLTDQDLSAALEYGRLMRDGRVRLPNVRHGDIDNIENYTDGKVGEIAFCRWLETQNLDIVHKPFRSDYSRLDPDDDFLVRLRGRVVQVEVRHKTRSTSPRSNFDHCSSTIRADRVYVFTDRCRLQRSQRGEELAVRHFQGQVLIVGWIDPRTFQSEGVYRQRGSPMYDDGGSVNFVTRRDEWTVEIQHLHEMSELISGQRDHLIPWR